MAIEFWSEPTFLSTDGYPYQRDTKMVRLADGNLLVVTQHDPASGNGTNDVWATILRPDGTLSRPAFQLNLGSTAFNEGAYFAIEALANGGFAVAYAIFETDQIGVEIYNADTSLRDSYLLDTPAGTEGLPFGSLYHNLEIATNTNGVVLVSATIRESDLSGPFAGQNPVVYGWTVKTNGSISNPILIDGNGAIGLNPNAEDPLLQNLVALDDGRFAVAILERDAFGLTSNGGVDIRLLKEDGSLDALIDVTAPGDMEAAPRDMAFDPESGLYVVYLNFTDDQYEMAQINVATGQVTGTVVLGSQVLNGNAPDPKIEIVNAEDGNSRIVVFIPTSENTGLIQEYDGLTPVGAPLSLFVPDDGWQDSFDLIDLGGDRLATLEFGSPFSFSTLKLDADTEADGYLGEYIGTTGNDIKSPIPRVSDYYMSFGDDSLSDGPEVRNFFGMAGNDTFSSGINAGGRTIDGGSGVDTYNALGLDPVSIDLASGFAVSLAVLGVPGNTLIDIENANGALGNDRIFGDNGINRLDGRGGSDILSGRGDSDTIYGGADNDFIQGGTGDDFLYGEDGDDTFFQYRHSSGTFRDVIDGGEGEDTLRFAVMDETTGTADSTSGTAATIDLEAGNGNTEQGQIYDITSIEVIYAGNGVSIIQGRDDTNERFFGQSGDDELSGGDGNDLLDGGNGGDTLNGEEGDDIFIGGTGNDVQSGGADNDTFFQYRHSGSEYFDEIDGGDGIDTLRFATADSMGNVTAISGAALTLNLVSGGGFIEEGGGFLEQTYQVESVEIVYAGNGVSNITGRDDVGEELYGQGGADNLNGGGGDDFLHGGTAGDILTGGDGIDTASYTGSTQGVVVNLDAGGGTGTGQLGDADGDLLFGIENLTGSDHRDFLFGTDGVNILNGAGGFDVMQGYGGDDVYAVDDGLDAVIEAAGEGFDNVFVSIDYIIDAEQEIESAILTGNAVTLRGSDSDNQLFGNDNVNVLEGKGGTDYLLGLGGDDIFQVSLEANATDLDVFGDFEGAGQIGGDRIALDASIWGTDGIVYQVSQTSFIVATAQNTNQQQFIIQNLTAPQTDLIAGDDYYFG